MSRAQTMDAASRTILKAIEEKAELRALNAELLAVLKDFGGRFAPPHWINTDPEWLALRERYEAVVAKVEGP